MQTRRGVKKFDGGEKKPSAAKKVKKKSSATGKKRRTPLIKSNHTTITNGCAVGTTNFSLLNVSETHSEKQPTCAAPKNVKHVKDVGEVKWAIDDGKDSDNDEVFHDSAEIHVTDEKIIEDGLKFAGITEGEVSFPHQKLAIQTAAPSGKEDESIGSVLQQKMPAMQTAPPSSKEDELDEFVQRIGSLLPQLLSQNPVSFVKITQTCFHEFMTKVSESKLNLLLHLYQGTMVCIDFYQVTMV